jgi:hypothetical protein
MSFDLGNWWQQLQCDLCTGNVDPPIDLTLPDDYFDNGGLPDDFWDEPPDPPDSFDFDFELPDPHPFLEFPDGGIIFGIKGTF